MIVFTLHSSTTTSMAGSSTLSPMSRRFVLMMVLSAYKMFQWPNVASAILAFTEYLKTNVHARIQTGSVIWYDSMLANGAISWQNTLNSSNAYAIDDKCMRIDRLTNNSPGFNASDGLFVNYWYNDSLANQAASTAGPRKRDVFMV